MNLIQLIACIGLITGCFVLLHISPIGADQRAAGNHGDLVPA